MRKALNIMQSRYMASQCMASQRITEEAVYLCTGNPMPRDIEQISHDLLNKPFVDSFKRISEMKARKGLALIDIVREVAISPFDESCGNQSSCFEGFLNRFVLKNIKMASDVRAPLINDLADIEYRLSLGCNEKLQLGSLVSSFTLAKIALKVAAT